MTQAYRPVGLASLQRGDRVTIQFTAAGDWPVSSMTRDGDSTRLDLTVGLAGNSYTVLVDRPVEVPTKPGAVVFPRRPGSDYAYFLDEDGAAWRDQDGDVPNPDDIAEKIAAGTHYVAFEGVEVPTSGRVTLEGDRMGTDDI